MPKIRNNGRESVHFVVGVRNGEAQTESLKAGEVRDIEVDVENPRVKGMLLADLITIEGGRGRKKTEE